MIINNEVVVKKIEWKRLNGLDENNGNVIMIIGFKEWFT